MSNSIDLTSLACRTDAIFLRFQASGRRARSGSHALRVNSVARDSRSALAFALTCKTQKHTPVLRAIASPVLISGICSMKRLAWGGGGGGGGINAPPGMSQSIHEVIIPCRLFDLLNKDYQIEKQIRRKIDPYLEIFFC